MKLSDVVERGNPQPWSEGDTIPWNEPGFSQRMLKFHLSQETDAASRRSSIIEQHVAFLHQTLLGGQAARVLDLGCGPGLYSQRLTRLGHTCRGIDFSPASVAYAREQAATAGLAIDYVEGDLRQVEYGTGYDLAMLIYGEFNVFKPIDARTLLTKAWAALKPGGRLVLEPSPEGHVRAIGGQRPSWYTEACGLFSAAPHLLLEENFWDEEHKAATCRYFVIDAASGAVTRWAGSYQAYSDSELEVLLAACGFEQVCFYPNLTGTGERDEHFFVVTACRPG